MNMNPSGATRFTIVLFGLLTALLFTPSVLAQVCSANPITLSSQAEVDAFQGTYGPCDTITATLTVSGNDITNLNGLSGVVSVNVPAHLQISNNPALTNLDGLSGLVSVYWLKVLSNTTLADIDGLSSLVTASGPVEISGNTLLTNLNGLSGLTSLPFGALLLENNASLSDISGVSGITSIGASLFISDNDALTNLDSLAALTNVASSITIWGNDALTNINGLAAAANGFNATVNIIQNSSLVSLQGLEGLTSVTGLVIRENALLTNLDPLSNLTSVGNVAGVVIWNNTALTSIDGLAGLESVEWIFDLRNNPALSQCSVLETLLDDVDDFLPGPGPGPDGIPDVGGEVTVEVNSDGCNSIEDIVGSVEPPVEPPPSGEIATPVPTLGLYSLMLLVLLTLATGLAGLNRRD